MLRENYNKFCFKKTLTNIANFIFSSRRVNDNDKFEVKYLTAGNYLSAEAFEQCFINHMIEELKKKPNAEKIDFNSKELKRELEKHCKCVMKQFVDDVSGEYKRFLSPI